jgi:(1->4)-alpha-D-glucan 1-alpha-D-glucosylmutase
VSRGAPPLTATYRLQLHKDFPLDEARRIAPYLARLGVSHLYLSPVTTARPGSTHGYDVADPTRANPELGGEEALAALSDELKRLGLGLVLDVVPNHMGIGPSNPMWEDMLARGRESAYAPWFDVDWTAGTEARVKGKILLPVLGAKFEEVLAKDEISLVRQDGRVRVKYFDHTFPADPATTRDLPDDLAQWAKGEEGRTRLAEFLGRQHYALAFWRRAASEINYRRFFDINELAGLRQEDPAVFEATHARVLEWLADGKIDALRIDHIDGLRDPLGYLENLRDAAAERRPGETVPVFVEKILSPGEHLREEWPVAGTTGYEFLNDLEALFLDPPGVARMEQEYRRATGLPDKLDFPEIAHRGKTAVLHGALAADVGRLARVLWPAVKSEAAKVDVDRRAIANAIAEVIAALPVYRTYADGRTKLHREDRAVLKKALKRVHDRGTEFRAAVELVGKVLLGELAPEHARAREFVLRFQQTSGPATAKGVEDTALYSYVPVASRNEVGGEPDRPLEDSVRLLHAANGERASDWPVALVCTNTHDTKRSADLRARVDALTEMPELWTRHFDAWHEMNRRHRGRSRRRIVPDVSAEWLLYQTLVGIWPVAADGSPPDAETLESLRDRVIAYMQKATREAKSRTSWTDPDPAWEEALERFVTAILDAKQSARFLKELSAFAAVVARPAIWNALSRALVHATVPGTTDVYQGDELWNLAMVDPDNRRPVDYGRRERLLRELDERREREGPERLAASLLASADEGSLKLYVMSQALRLRRERADVFRGGGYEGLAAIGGRASHLFAFARGAEDERVVVVVPRLTVALSNGDAPVGRKAWCDTRLPLPPLATGRVWTDRLTGRTISPERGAVAVGELFEVLPLALLVSEADGRNAAPGRSS